MFLNKNGGCMNTDSSQDSISSNPYMRYSPEKLAEHVHELAQGIQAGHKLTVATKEGDSGLTTIGDVWERILRFFGGRGNRLLNNEEATQMKHLLEASVSHITTLGQLPESNFISDLETITDGI